MPNREKVVKGLYEAVKTIEDHVPVRFIGYAEQACWDAIELLKEQEPVKPVQHLVYTTKGWFCGACDGRLNRLGKYCSFCGRSVKWE